MTIETLIPSQSSQQAAISQIAKDQTAALPGAVAEAQAAGEDKAELKKSIPVSPHIEALAKKEKAIRRMMAEVQSEKQRLAVESERYKQEYLPKSLIKEDPLGVLLQNGVSFDQIVELALQSQTPESPAIRQMRMQIKQMEEAQRQAQENSVKSQKDQYEAALNQIRSDAKLLASNDTRFAMIKETGMEEAVVERIREHFDQTGQILPLEMASEEVEQALIDEATKVLQYQKIKDRLKEQGWTHSEIQKAQDQALSQAAGGASGQDLPNPQTPRPLRRRGLGYTETPRSSDPHDNRTQIKIKTLTNRMAASTAPTSSGVLTREQRRERAILAAKGQL